ncbi:MAG TPA: chorismate synthase [Candidatus Polarisedimenticolia bacterium]|jgi:chorismate synthase|nr:chorismate synthase [Candidatus Polarisedimenticolia bacterium]
MLRFLTAGESHGPALVAILDGIPSGMSLLAADIDSELKRRQHGYGRGGRMKIEQDRVEILSGVRHGRTIGSPIALKIANRDWTNWQKPMAIEPVEADDLERKRVTRPRPGHADLAGALKHDADDARDILERASARETTARVAVGAVCRKLLAAFDVGVISHTVALGSVALSPGREMTWEEIAAAEGSALRCADREVEQKMIEEIDRAMSSRDSVGGSFQVVARGVPAGLGSHRHWDLRLNARLAAALCSIQSIKAVSVGDGVEAATRMGSEFHDEIHYDPTGRRFYRRTNHAGGIEGGITNGEEIRLRVYVKPLSTLPKALHSVDLKSKEEFQAQVERTDVSAIAAAGVVGEAMVAFVLAEAFLEKFGGDSMKEITRNHRGYLQQLRDY